MFLTRLGFGSKMVVTGDVTQVDLPDGTSRGSGSGPAHPRRRRRRPLHRADLRDVVRHRLVSDIVDAYDRSRRRPPRAPGGWPRPADAAPAAGSRRAANGRPDVEVLNETDVPRRRHRAGGARPLRHGRDEGPSAGRALHHSRRGAGHGPASRAVDGPSRTRPTSGFPMDDLRPGVRTRSRTRVLGDIVLCPRIAARRPRTPGTPTERGAAAALHARDPPPARLRPRGAGRGTRDVRAAAPAALDLPRRPRPPHRRGRGADMFAQMLLFALLSVVVAFSLAAAESAIFRMSRVRAAELAEEGRPGSLRWSPSSPTPPHTSPCSRSCGSSPRPRGGVHHRGRPRACSTASGGR